MSERRKGLERILESALWHEEPFTKGQALIDLIFHLAHKEEGDVLINGVYCPIKRGQVSLSRRRLATRWKWGQSKAHRFIKFLEKKGLVTHPTTHPVTHPKVIHNDTHFIPITIANYAQYNSINTVAKNVDNYVEKGASDSPSDSPCDSPPIAFKTRFLP